MSSVPSTRSLPSHPGHLNQYSRVDPRMYPSTPMKSRASGPWTLPVASHFDSQPMHDTIFSTAWIHTTIFTCTRIAFTTATSLYDIIRPRVYSLMGWASGRTNGTRESGTFCTRTDSNNLHHPAFRKRRDVRVLVDSEREDRAADQDLEIRPLEDSRYRGRPQKSACRSRSQFTHTSGPPQSTVGTPLDVGSLKDLDLDGGRGGIFASIKNGISNIGREIVTVASSIPGARKWAGPVLEGLESVFESDYYPQNTWASNGDGILSWMWGGNDSSAEASQAKSLAAKKHRQETLARLKREDSLFVNEKPVR